MSQPGTSRIPGIARSMEFNRKSGLRPPNALSTAHGDHLKAKNGIKSSKIKDNNIPITEDSIRCVGNGSLEHLTEIDKLWGSTELIPGAQCSSSNNHADEVGGESTDYLHVADSCFGDGEDYSKHRPTVQSNLSPKSSNFGFIPSPSLSRSFIKIAKDMEPTDSTVVVTASSSIESDLLNNSGIATLESVQCKQRDDAGLRCNLSPDERPCGTGEHNAARGSQINAEDPNNNDNNESLFSVTQMLAVLKHYVEKSRCTILSFR